MKNNPIDFHPIYFFSYIVIRGVFFLKKVLILFGGNSSEHFVSCKSASSIVKNIDKNLFSYEMVGITKENKWYKYKDDFELLENGDWQDGEKEEILNIIEYVKTFDVVFPMLHGANGEDGKLQGMLSLFSIPYVGCKMLASAIAMDKEISKILFESLKIPQVPYVVLNEDTSLEKVVEKINFPVIVKPANGGSSIGIRVASTKEELESAIEEAKKFDKKVIVEKFIKMRELECAILEKDKELIVSQIGEIQSANLFYDYEAKYVNKESKTIISKDLPEEVVDKIRSYAKQIFEHFYCNGFSRIDFFYEEETKNIYINEINTIPGFTSISMYPELIKNEGISYQELITILINNA